MRTAKLTTPSFMIICPHCEQKVQNSQDESLLHTTDTTEPGQPMRCTHEPCKKMFRLPTTLKAEAE
jgi:hypothetical protein